MFHELKGLRQDDVARVAARTAARVTAMLARRGLGPGSQADEPTDEPDLLTTLHAASVTERVALGPKAGWRITHVGAGGPHTAAVRVPPSAATLLAEADGYNVHAGVFVHARARPTLERVCKYILRPPLCRDRLTLAGDGRVFWELKRPYDNGTTHLAFEPLEFLERLAGGLPPSTDGGRLVPPPKSHTVIYNGVLSSHAAWRAEVLPVAEPVAAPVSEETLALSPAVVPQPPDPALAEPIDDVPELRARRQRWAALLQRVFGLDILHCDRCGGRREVVAFIVRPAEVKRICAHLGYPTEPPLIAPARAPPQAALWDQRLAG